MLIFLYLLPVLTALSHAQNIANERKPQHSPKSHPHGEAKIRLSSNMPKTGVLSPGSNAGQVGAAVKQMRNKQLQLASWHQRNGDRRRMNFLRRNYTIPKLQNSQNMDDAVEMITQRNLMDNAGKRESVHARRMKEREVALRRQGRSRDKEARSGIPPNIPAADTEKTLGRQRTRWSESKSNGWHKKRTTNEKYMIPQNNMRRSYDRDSPQQQNSEKSKLPIDDLNWSLKDIDAELAKYKNGIGLFQPNYVLEDPKIREIKQNDLPIDKKVDTLLQTIKKSARRRGGAYVPAEDISDISI